MDVKEVICYKCGKCGLVYHVKEWAERCCKPKKCERCGAELPYKSYWLLCDKCRVEKEKEEELKRFSKAQKYSIKNVPPERCEMMYSDYYGYNEGYFSEIEELEEYCADNDIEMPDYVYCTSCHQLNIDVDSLVENECEDLHEITRCEDQNNEEQKSKASVFEFMLSILGKIILLSGWNNSKSSVNLDDYLYDLYFVILEFLIETIQGTKAENLETVFKKDNNGCERENNFK